LDWIAVRDHYYGDADTTALFLSQWKRRITTNGVRGLVKKYTAGIDKHITAHKLRSTAGTQAAAAGISIQTIAEMLGHQSIQTTKRYVKVLDQEKNNAINTLDNLI
jgi:site-specific recombinase XerD